MTRRIRFAWIAGLTAGMIGGLFALPSIPQSQAYHATAAGSSGANVARAVLA